ncbi:hypothetical protein CR513_12025, partial [Mucuna pruriens]
MTNDYNLVRDKAKRNIMLPKRFGQADLIYYALNVGEEIQGNEPILDSKESENWLEAMKNKAWILVDLPKNERMVGYKWIFKKKEGIQDIKTAFLHGDLEETIYMQQSEGFAKDNRKVGLLKKS